MKLRVRYFAMFRDIPGVDTLEMDFTGRKVLDLRKIISSANPEFERRGMLIAVNERYAEDSMDLHEGDTVAVFPPVSGG